METTTVESIVKHRALTPFDRCDRCGFQAFILAVMGDFELTFCGHHGRENEDQLILQGFSISDETHRINEAPSPSASELD